MPKGIEDLLVLEDVERLLEDLLLLGGDEDGRRPAVPRDDDVLVSACQFIEELAQPRPGFRQGYRLGHDHIVQNPAQTPPGRLRSASTTRIERNLLG